MLTLIVWWTQGDSWKHSYCLLTCVRLVVNSHHYSNLRGRSMSGFSPCCSQWGCGLEPVRRQFRCLRKQTAYRIMAEALTNHGTTWTDREVKALLSIWGDTKIQEELDGAVWNQVVYKHIAQQLKDQQGINRNWKQCRAKIIEYCFREPSPRSSASLSCLEVQYSN